jgi:AcrR family transcriptional regulator
LRKGEATKARIVEEASRQAAIKGLAAVSLNDIADAVGLSKSGLFKHFDSKEAMQQEVVLGMLDRFGEMVWRPAKDLPAGRQRLEKVFDGWMHWAEVEHKDSGCPIVAVTVELDDQPGPLRELLHERQKRWFSMLSRDFAALRDPPLAEQEARLAAFQLKSFVMGHGEQSRLMGDENARAMTRAAFAALLDRTEKG